MRKFSPFRGCSKNVKCVMIGLSAERGGGKMRKKLPVGIEHFEEFSLENFYYVDKTMFISELLQNWGKVILFTRPRRFGKSLNMSMLKCFLKSEMTRSCLTV